MERGYEECQIAIIGMACRYPGAQDPTQLWENVLARRCQFRAIPPCRLPLADYWDPDPAAQDKTYGSRVAVIDGFEFDWVARRIPKRTIDSTDVVHWLALDVALSALDDAGVQLESVSRERTGVLLGNTLTGEQFRSQHMRARWPFVQRVLASAAAARGLPHAAIQELVGTAEQYYKSVFDPVTEDTLAGGLSNTIAGRICNYLDLHGGGYTVDGACASSLIAVATAASRLADGDIDLALAGGVDVSLDTFELVGFSKTGALTPDDMTVYDRRANGFIPGEGCGFVVLKRLADARADGDFVYAVIRGWGISSDGRGGITAPNAKGQSLAVLRAYERAGYDLSTVPFVEGHGTGTAVGDPVEIKALALSMPAGEGPDVRRCGLTSLKSVIGHTKAASGIGGLLKAAISVNRRVLPPTAGCTQPNKEFDESGRELYPIIAGETRKRTETLRAGVSAMGFGGVNCHVTIESADPPSANLQPGISERALLVSHQDTELFVFEATEADSLLARLHEVCQQAEGMCVGEMVDLAAELVEDLERGDNAPPASRFRVAVVASSPEELMERLDLAEKKVTESQLTEGSVEDAPKQGIWIGNAANCTRIGFLFPGQGSQQINMARVLVERHEWAQEMFDQACGIVHERGRLPIAEIMFRPLDRCRSSAQGDEWRNRLTQTEAAQPAICLASAIWLRRLCDLGLPPSVVGGHSLGELTAFYAAGAFDFDSLMSLATLRGQAMAACTTGGGSMVSLACDRQVAEEIVDDVPGYLVIANLNSPKQTVVSGETAAAERCLETAAIRGVSARLLPVSNAFHSSFVKDAAEVLRAHAPIPRTMGQTRLDLLSAMTAQSVLAGTDLHEHFAQQVLSQVDFVSTVNSMAAKCDIIVEVGPGKVLSGLTRAVIGDTGPACLPVESRPGVDRDLNALLASFFVRGGRVRRDALYERRLVQPFVPASQRRFIENQCERPFKAELQSQSGATELPGSVASLIAESAGVPLDSLGRYVREHHDFLGAVVRADMNRTMPSEPTGPSPAASHAPQDVAPAPTGAADGGSIDELLLDLVEDRAGFPKATLSLDQRLLDDLNLDSIKTVELIAEATKRLGVPGKIDPAPLANLPLAEIAARLQQVMDRDDPRIGGEDSDESTSTEPPSWVRNFTVECVPDPLPVSPSSSPSWNATDVLVVSESAGDEVAVSVAAALRQRASAVRVASFSDVYDEASISTHRCSTIVSILPRNAPREQPEAERFVAAVRRLSMVPHLLGTPPDEGVAPTAVFVQFGGGRFGRYPDAADISTCCCSAFAATLCADLHGVRARVLDFSPSAPAAELAERVIAEISTPDVFCAVGYDRSLVRHTPRLRISEPAEYMPRDIEWSRDDVVLVTGGARGITAECALAFGKATGVRMALVGSTPCRGGTDSKEIEIQRTLDRFSALGVDVKYYVCNVADPSAVAAALSCVRSELGPVTGVIHGAGINRPRNVGQVTPSKAVEETAPKVLGAINLLQALNGEDVKLFAALSSTIGILGAARNGWYGFGNEALDVLLASHARSHPQTTTISIPFSVWDEVGMGFRMGSVRYLASLGVSAIPVSEGAQRFLQLMEYDPGSPCVVVSARAPDTWETPAEWVANFASGEQERPQPSVPKCGERCFVEDVLYLWPGIELTSRTRLTPDRDPYVLDHVWRDSLLFPTVFGLEAMAQAVAALVGRTELLPLAIENIHLERPIVVDRGKGTEIEIRAIGQERTTPAADTKVLVEIRSDTTGFSIPHFSAVFSLSPAPAVPAMPEESIDESLDIRAEDIYGPLLFQGERFQRLRRVCSLTSEKCVFQAERAMQSAYLLGDPYFRDALLQSVQLLFPRDISLPILIERLQIDSHSDGAWEDLVCVATHENKLDREHRAAVAVCEVGGRVVEQLSGYVLRVLDQEPKNPTAAELADPDARDEALVGAALASGADAFGLTVPHIALSHIPGLHDLSKAERHRRELPILKRVLSTAGLDPEGIEIRWEEGGRPSLASPPQDTESSPSAKTAEPDHGISMAHDERMLIAVAGSWPQGCDVEPVMARPHEEWLALLGSTRTELLNSLIEQGDDRDVAGTRIWCAREAAAKATQTAQAGSLGVLGRSDDAVLLGEHDAEVALLTIPIRCTRGGLRILAVVAKKRG